jgi:hypothetical protein
MHIRPITLFDLLNLRRYRQGLLSLDSEHACTYGSALAPVSLIAARMRPRSRTYTAFCKDTSQTIIGQVAQKNSEAYTRLTFLSPQENLGADEIFLLDHLANQAGEWGALHITASVNEHAPLYQSLRRAGYSMYAWQKIWRLPPSSSSASKQNVWRSPNPDDIQNIRVMYNQIVPALIQPVDPLLRYSKGLVWASNSKLEAYSSVTFGPLGIWLQPLIHPDADCTGEALLTLPQAIPNRYRRPVYLCQRSYQAWLESTLEELCGESSPRQAVMVKHLSALQREGLKRSVPESAVAKPAAPAAQSSSEELN